MKGMDIDGTLTFQSFELLGDVMARYSSSILIRLI